MMPLSCDICGGGLHMAEDGNSAICEQCGVSYDKARLMAKMQPPQPPAGQDDDIRRYQAELGQIRQQIADLMTQVPRDYKASFEKGRYRAGGRWIATVILCIASLVVFYLLYTRLLPPLLSGQDQKVILSANIILGILAIWLLTRMILAPLIARRVGALGRSLQGLKEKERQALSVLQALDASSTPNVANSLSSPTVPAKKPPLSKRILEGVLILAVASVGAIGINEYVSGDIRYHMLGDELVVYNYQQAPENFDEALRYIEESFLSEGKVIKWTNPILLRVQGSPTDVDVETIRLLAEEFNKIRGFPGIEIVESGDNAQIYYTADTDEMNEFRREKDLDFHFESLCSTTWSRELNCFIWAQVTMRPHNVSQGKFNRALLHECYHMVGFEHTDRRGSMMRDGVAFGLDDIDILAFRMVYNPEIKSGISFAEFEAYYQNADIADFIYDWEKTQWPFPLWHS